MRESMRVFEMALITKEVSKACLEIYLNEKIYWVKHSISCTTLFANHLKCYWVTLVFFETDKSSAVFLNEMLNEVVMSWLQKVLQPVVLKSFIRKLIKEDFSLEDNSLSLSSVNNALGAVNALKKTEINSWCNRD